MGNCFQKNGKGKGQSEIDRVLSVGTLDGKQREFRNQLNHDIEMQRQLKAEGLEHSMTAGGLTFTVNLDGAPQTPRRRPPRRLDALRHRPRQPNNEDILGLMDYDTDERSLMADILRMEQTANRMLQAQKQVNRRDDVINRRKDMMESTKVKAESKVGVEELAERKRNLKKLAEDTKAARMKAAKKIKKASE